MAIRRCEIEVGGGSTASPAAICARVNQRASSSSALLRATESAAALAMKPSIKEDGKGQGCEEW